MSILNNKTLQCQPWTQKVILIKRTIYYRENNTLHKAKTFFTSKNLLEKTIAISKKGPNYLKKVSGLDKKILALLKMSQL